MKTIINFSEGSSSISLEGIPDLSLGHKSNKIGIILAWEFTFLGIKIEGKKVRARRRS